MNDRTGKSTLRVGDYDRTQIGDTSEDQLVKDFLWPSRKYTHFSGRRERLSLWRKRIDSPCVSKEENQK